MSDDASPSLPFFAQNFGLDDRSLTQALDTALERPLDYADLFFEYSTLDSVALEQGMVKTGMRRLSQGVGVRAQAEDRQGYAHSDELTVDSVQLAASTARAIAEGPRTQHSLAVRPGAGWPLGPP